MGEKKETTGENALLEDVSSSCRICGNKGPHGAWSAGDMRKGGRKGGDDRYTYFQCRRCQCLQIESLPEDTARLYEGDYYSFSPVSERKLTDPAWKAVIRKAAAQLGTDDGPVGAVMRAVCKVPPHPEWFRKGRVTTASKILDVGCGTGSLLVRIWKEGYHGAEGADPFIKEDIKYPNGLVIRKAFVEELQPSYDFIMMNHSLEHAPDQAATLREAWRLLSPSGTVLVRVPLASSYAWEHYVTDWVQLDSPRHLYLHSERSMREVAEKAGLTVDEVVYDSWAFQFLGSELCKMGVLIDDQKLYYEKGKKLATADKVYGWEMEAKKLNGEGRGDMACFYLKKYKQ